MFYSDFKRNMVKDPPPLLTPPCRLYRKQPSVISCVTKIQNTLFFFSVNQNKRLSPWNQKERDYRGQDDQSLSPSGGEKADLSHVHTGFSLLILKICPCFLLFVDVIIHEHD